MGAGREGKRVHSRLFLRSSAQRRDNGRRSACCVDVGADSPNIDLGALPKNGVDLIVAAHMLHSVTMAARIAFRTHH